MKKIGDSFKGIGAGIIMIIIGVCLLWWNEGNNVKNLKTTAELEDTYIDVSSDTVDSKNEGKLIATNGKLLNEKELTDTNFGVTVKTPLMTRTVEVYQWDENTRTDDKDKTTYTYEKKWSDRLIDSSDFHNGGHDNPTEKPYDNATYTSDDVKVGAFSLTSNQINRLSTKATYNSFNEETINALNLKISGNYITNSNDIDHPEIGDIRIVFNYNDSTDISILAVQSGTSFKPFTSKVGKSVSRIQDGTHSGKEIIEGIKSEDKLFKWIFRLVGTLLCCIGFGAILSPISTITGFIPILGRVVGAAVGFISFILGLSLSLIIIAVAWIRFRPVLGISLLLLAAVLIVLLIIRGKKTKEDNENNNPQPVEQ